MPALRFLATKPGSAPARRRDSGQLLPLQAPASPDCRRRPRLVRGSAARNRCGRRGRRWASRQALRRARARCVRRAADQMDAPPRIGPRPHALDHIELIAGGDGGSAGHAAAAGFGSSATIKPPATTAAAARIAATTVWRQAPRGRGRPAKALSRRGAWAEDQMWFSAKNTRRSSTSPSVGRPTIVCSIGLELVGCGPDRLRRRRG